MRPDDILSMALLLGIIPTIVALVWFFIAKARHKERMALIEKGLSMTPAETKQGPFNDVLMWGMLAGGIGTGLLIAYILLERKVVYDDMILGILSLIFGGIGLITYYLIKKRSDRK